MVHYIHCTFGWIEVLIDARIHSEHGQVIWCDIKPGSVKRSSKGCSIRSIFSTPIPCLESFLELYEGIFEELLIRNIKLIHLKAYIHIFFYILFNSIYKSYICSFKNNFKNSFWSMINLWVNGNSNWFLCHSMQNFILLKLY